MIKKFAVTNFKNFEERVELDFSRHANYEFNKEVIQDDCVSKGIFYGINGSGKSNLALALFDIVLHLTDKEKLADRYLPFYLNLQTAKQQAEFEYTFIFEGIELIYRYSKMNPFLLVREALIIDGKEYLWFDYSEGKGECKLKGTESLNICQNEDPMMGQISRIKFVKSNAMLSDNSVNRAFVSFIKFVNNMLLFYSLDQVRYQGYRVGGDSYTQGILRANKLKEFETFLKDKEVEYELVEMNLNGMPEIGCKMERETVPFASIASTGTKALALFYYWYIILDNVSLVFLDEFDAFYHHELAKTLVELLKEKRNTQVFFSTHNTDLLSNDLLRPDAYFVIHDNKIDAFNNMTNKDIRQAHNLQKMYKAGAFSEKSN